MSALTMEGSLTQNSVQQSTGSGIGSVDRSDSAITALLPAAVTYLRIDSAVDTTSGCGLDCGRI
jgi:hypothetical protein